MKTMLLLIHVLVTVILIILILLQNSKGGLGTAAGGEIYRSRRGAEKIVFTGTIIFGVLFLITSILSLLVR
jgi:preprotein translocase subunit SecG